MTRRAVRSGFEELFDELLDATYEEFDVVAALGGGRSRAASSLLKSAPLVERRVVRPALDEYRADVVAQFETLLDYVESGEPIDAYREELLARDRFVDALRADLPESRRERVRETLVDRQRRFGEALEPLVASPADELLPAVRAELDPDETERLLDVAFSFTDPLEEHRDAFVFAERVDPAEALGPLAGALPTVEVEFTDELARSMSRARVRTRRHAERRLDGRLDAG